MAEKQNQATQQAGEQVKRAPKTRRRERKNVPVGHVHIASATFFDIGVFALVVGSTMLILTALAHQSVRGHRFHARMLEEQEQEARKAEAAIQAATAEALARGGM